MTVVSSGTHSFIAAPGAAEHQPGRSHGRCTRRFCTAYFSNPKSACQVYKVSRHDLSAGLGQGGWIYQGVSSTHVLIAVVVGWLVVVVVAVVVVIGW